MDLVFFVCHSSILSLPYNLIKLRY
jgi:hypothetical protein